jgi:hypothetical protein
VSKRVWIVGAMLWAVVVTSLRAARLPNDFSKEHWLIDYRFGFVKRGLVGTLVSLAAKLAHARPTEALVNILSSVLFVAFCAALVWLGVHIIRRSGWSVEVALAVLVFLSSPFVVMSAHLIGYFDNIIILLTMLSLALLFKRRIWLATAVQVVSILVHENALLVGFPAFCVAWRLIAARQPQSEADRSSYWPLLVPPVAFLLLALSQSVAPIDREQSLTAYLSSYPFIARNIADVRVPHWIMITFYDSYVLHQGQFLGRVLSQSMIGLVLPSVLAILGFVFEANAVRVLSAESMILLAACALPQAMHVLAWDTARIWTYSILCAFFVLWIYVEMFPGRKPTTQFIRLICLMVLFMNVIGVTPLMDGLRDHFDLTTRLLLYAPVLTVAFGVAAT